MSQIHEIMSLIQNFGVFLLRWPWQNCNCGHFWLSNQLQIFI